jgi:hypothetical protein
MTQLYASDSADVHLRKPHHWRALADVGGGLVDGVHCSVAECRTRAVLTTAEEWYDLGQTASKQSLAYQPSQQTCYENAAAFGDAVSGPAAWNNLGSTCGGGTVGGVKYSLQQCYARALAIDSSHAMAWYNLGRSGGGTVDGAKWSAHDCLVRSLELNATRQRAWFALARHGGGIVGGVEHAAAECRARAPAPATAREWFQRAQDLTGSTSADAEEPSPQACYENAAAFGDPKVSPDAWNSLGVACHGGTVGGVKYCRQQCYEQVLAIDSSHVHAWFNLSTLGGGTVDGVKRSPRDCLVRSLELDATYKRSWLALARHGGGNVGGVHHSAAECRARALPTTAEEWYVQGSSWTEADETSEQACYENGAALEDGAASSNAWHNLGACCEGGTVGGVEYGEQQCYEQALSLNSSFALAWYNLGRLGGTVDGVKWSPRDCLVRSLELDGWYKPAWSTLACEGGGLVDGAHYSPAECRSRALPTTAAEWFTQGEWYADQRTYNPGDGRGGSVSGAPWSERECFVRVVELHPDHRDGWDALARLGGGSVSGIECDASQCRRTAAACGRP